MVRLHNVVGFDDGPFPRERRTGQVLLVGAVCARSRLDGVLSGQVVRDGDDATQVMARLLLGSQFEGHVRAILLNGIAVAGFNVIDIHGLRQAVGRPVLVVARRPPRLDKIRRALDLLEDGDRKWSFIQQRRADGSGRWSVPAAGGAEPRLTPGICWRRPRFTATCRNPCAWRTSLPAASSPDAAAVAPETPVYVSESVTDVAQTCGDVREGSPWRRTHRPNVPAASIRSCGGERHASLASTVHLWGLCHRCCATVRLLERFARSDARPLGAVPNAPPPATPPPPGTPAHPSPPAPGGESICHPPARPRRQPPHLPHHPDRRLQRRHPAQWAACDPGRSRAERRCPQPFGLAVTFDGKTAATINSGASRFSVTLIQQHHRHRRRA